MAQNFRIFLTQTDKKRHTRGTGPIAREWKSLSNLKVEIEHVDSKFLPHRHISPGRTEFMQKKSNNLDHFGFTLVEFLVVIAIIGIVAGVFGLHFLKYAPTYELRSNARTLYAELQNAKIGAIRSGRDWGVVCNEGTSVCDIVSSGADGNVNTPVDNVIFKTINMKLSKHDIRIGHGTATSAIGGGAIGADNVTYAGNTLIFNNRGVSNAGVIYIQNNNNESYAVGTNMFGNIFLRSWNGGGWN